MITNPRIERLLGLLGTGSARLALAALLACASAAAVTSCGQATAASKPRSFTVAGTVRDEIVSIQAPLIASPAPNLTVGISKSRLPAAPGLHSAVMTDTTRPKLGSGTQAASAISTSAPSPRVAGQVVFVRPRVGDKVKRGEVVAVLDNKMLLLGIRKAQADSDAARAQLDVIDARISDVRDKRSTAVDARDKVLTALDTVASGKAKLAAAAAQAASGKNAALAKKSELLAARSQLESGIAQLSATIARLQKLPVPPKQRIAALKAKRSALRGKLAQVNAGLAKVNAALAKVTAGQRTIAAGEAKLAAGESKARTGLATVNDAISKIDDGLAKLRRARKVAEATLPVREAAVQTARDQAARAVIVSPVDGVTTQAMNVGETAMVGSPVVKVRRAGPSKVDTWLTLGLPFAKDGTRATITADSLAGRSLPAVVRTTDPDYAFPPSSFPTNEIHMMRTVGVTLALVASGDTLPPGTPVDVTFSLTK